MITTRAEAAQYLKAAGGVKLVVFGADGHEVAAMFVQGSHSPTFVEWQTNRSTTC